MINPAVFTITFLAAAVEVIEMVIIVVGVGAIRGWRSTLLGLRGMGARNATDDDIPAHGVDRIAFLLAFRGVVLEGLEVAIIVAAFGAVAGAFPSAALAAADRPGDHRRHRRSRPQARGAHPTQRPAVAGRHAAVRLVHQVAAAAHRACQPARSPTREVNHDRFLAQPGSPVLTPVIGSRCSKPRP